MLAVSEGDRRQYSLGRFTIEVYFAAPFRGGSSCGDAAFPQANPRDFVHRFGNSQRIANLGFYFQSFRVLKRGPVNALTTILVQFK